jgi:hypothetical protein
MIKVWIIYPGKFHDAIVMEEGDWLLDADDKLDAYEGYAMNMTDPSKKGRKYTIPIRSILYLEDWGEESMGFEKNEKEEA